MDSYENVRDPQARALIGLPPLEGRGVTVTTDQLADLLGLTPRHVQTLTRQGIVRRTAPARYDRDDCVRAYCADLRRKASGKGVFNQEYTAAKTRAAEAQAEKLETANAVSRRELIPADAVEREWVAILRDVRAAMLALPSRVQQRLLHLTAYDLTTIDREIRDALAELGGNND